MHLVLHLAGSGFVLNFKLCDLAYSSQVFSISWSPVSEGARRKLSSNDNNPYFFLILLNNIFDFVYSERIFSDVQDFY